MTIEQPEPEFFPPPLFLLLAVIASAAGLVTGGVFLKTGYRIRVLAQTIARQTKGRAL